MDSAARAATNEARSCELPSDRRGPVRHCSLTGVAHGQAVGRERLAQRGVPVRTADESVHERVPRQKSKRASCSTSMSTTRTATPLEPWTSCVSVRTSIDEPENQKIVDLQALQAADGTRTHDLLHGKQTQITRSQPLCPCKWATSAPRWHIVLSPGFVAFRRDCVPQLSPGIMYRRGAAHPRAWDASKVAGAHAFDRAPCVAE
jgi:hypothetical protein